MQDDQSSVSDPRPATEPFNDTSADIILRSSNNVDFYLYRIVLSLASPFFKDMFSLTQPTSTTVDQEDAPLHPITHSIIPVSEDEMTLDHMLRLTYPIEEPAPGTFDEIAKVLEASLKYQIGKVSTQTKAALLTFTQSDPLRVYAVACKLKLEHEARAAAMLWKAKVPSLNSQPCPCGHTCSAQSCGSGKNSYRSYRDARGRFLTCGCPEYYGMPPPPSDFQVTVAGASITFNTETEGVTAGSYFRLLQYVRTEAETFSFWPAARAMEGSEDATEDAGAYVSYFHDHPNADLIIQSGDGVQFRVHKLLLSIASAHQILEKCDKEDNSGDNLQVVYLDDAGTTLGCLLRLCYPFPEEIDLTLPQLARARAAAEKYNIPSAISHARRLMMEQVEAHPVRVYLLSKQYGWQADAEEATAECVRLESIDDMYAPEMETSPARVYYDLLKAHFDGPPGMDPGEGTGPKISRKKNKKRR